MNSRNRAYLALIVNVIIWGAALPIVKPALQSISPFAFLFYRYLIASLFMLPFIYVFRRQFRVLSYQHLFTIIFLEFLQLGVGLSFLYTGLSLTSALEAAFIGSSSPIFVTLGGILFLKEREEKHEWLGLTISALGTVLIIGAPRPHPNLGNIVIVCYCLSWMLYTTLAKKFYQHLPKAPIAIISCFVGLLSFAIISPLMSTIPPISSLWALGYPLLAIVYMGTLGSALAVGLYLYGQSRIEASEATLFTYLQPLIYIPLSILWLHDQLVPLQLVGLLLVSLGVFVAEKRTDQSK
jgi:drug/metabolite transporter (DMT)-like permease